MLITVQYGSHEEQTRHAAEFLTRQGYAVEPPDSDRKQRRKPQSEQAAPITAAPTAPAANNQRRPAQASSRNANANQPGSPAHEMSALDEKKGKISDESPSPKRGRPAKTTVPNRPTTDAQEREIQAELTASGTQRKRKSA